MEDERNLTLFVFYIIEERTSMTEIFVVKKRSDVEGISNFYSIKISTAKNKICEIKGGKRFMQEDYFRMSERIWFPAFDKFF